MTHHVDKSIMKIDFENTAIAFKDKSDKDLERAAWLFGLMNKAWFVNLSSKIGLYAIKWGLPFAATTVKATIFKQFVGGTSLQESQTTINKLFDSKVQCILDYGAEAKSSDEDFDKTKNETLSAIEFGHLNESVPCISTKLTGLATFDLLLAIQEGRELDSTEKSAYKRLLERIDEICNTASQKNVSVLVDAEESWIQDAIDHIVDLMMERYNKDRVVVYNTYQMYRKDRFPFLQSSHHQAKKKNYLLGAKLVRGAYLYKESERAEAMGYDNPICDSKADTDANFDQALRYCLDNYTEIAIVNATHNQDSSQLMASIIDQKNLPKSHPHLNFCQLFGMSDNLTYNLAHAGFQVAKYVPYGPVKDVVPYLIRRARENSSVTGDMSRELSFIHHELKRRGIKG